MSSTTPVQPQAAAQPGLQRSIGLGRVLFQAIGVMGPGASIVFGLGLIIANTGKASPFAMLLALIAAVFVAVAIGQLAARIPGAGGLYSFAATVFGPYAGFLVGWGFAIMTFILPTVGAVVFGIVGVDFCTTYLHFTPPWWVLSLIVLAATLVTTYLGVRASTAVTMVLGIIEVTILTVVSIVLVVHAGANNTLDVFNPSNAAQPGKSTLTWIFLGVVYSLATFVGFDSAVQLSEEANQPRAVVPRAMILAAGLIGLFYVFAMYTAVVAWGPNHLDGYLASPDPWREMTGKISGFVSFLVVLAILNSLAALTQAGYNGTTRLLFAMSRAGILPRPLSAIHPQHHTPHIAALATGVLATVAMFVSAWRLDGAFNVFIYMITIVSLVFIALYIVTCIGCIVYFLTKARSQFNVLLHVVIPIGGLLLLLPALYYSGNGLTYPASWSIPTVLVWLAIGVVILVVLAVQRRDITSESRRWTIAAAETGEA
jgi:amino acid transporter